ncbi:MAG: hypothetical protein ABJH98_18040 [Reichenbachiella sp.]|uniref:hypothetical protein n=1 Tax=Reichenbachiella sp. TaxID=2184521 RepID=UPI003296FFA3
MNRSLILRVYQVSVIVIPTTVIGIAIFWLYKIISRGIYTSLEVGILFSAMALIVTAMIGIRAMIKIK